LCIFQAFASAAVKCNATKKELQFFTLGALAKAAAAEKSQKDWNKAISNFCRGTVTTSGVIAGTLGGAAAGGALGGPVCGAWGGRIGAVAGGGARAATAGYVCP
jgi:hypothetical protein